MEQLSQQGEQQQNQEVQQEEEPSSDEQQQEQETDETTEQQEQPQDYALSGQIQQREIDHPASKDFKYRQSSGQRFRFGERRGPYTERGKRKTGF